MNDSQAEIQAIQARLRKIGRRSPGNVPSPSSLVSADLISTETSLPSSPQTTYRLRQSVRWQAGEQPEHEVITTPLQLPNVRRYATVPERVTTPTTTPKSMPEVDHAANETELPLRSYVRSPILSPSASRASSPAASSSSTPLPRTRRTAWQDTGDLQRLEAQVRRINELSAVQEAAMLELKAIAEQVESGQTATTDPDQDTTERTGRPRIRCEYLPTAVPAVDRDRVSGAYVVTARSINLLQKEQEAEQDAMLTAAALRQFSHRSAADGLAADLPQRRSRSPVKSALDLGIGKVLKPLIAPIMSMLSHWVMVRPTRRPTGYPKRSKQSSQMSNSETAAIPSFTIQDAALWTIGAIAARVGIDMLLASFPTLWLPVIAAVMAPAAIAIYQSTVDPKSGFTLGYRLLLIMIGLLLGGRL